MFTRFVIYGVAFMSFNQLYKPFSRVFCLPMWWEKWPPLTTPLRAVIPPLLSHVSYTVRKQCSDLVWNPLMLLGMCSDLVRTTFGLVWIFCNVLGPRRQARNWRVRPRLPSAPRRSPQFEWLKFMLTRQLLSISQQLHRASQLFSTAQDLARSRWLVRPSTYNVVPWWSSG